MRGQLGRVWGDGFAINVLPLNIMSHLVIHVRNKKKLPFIKELLRHIDYVEVIEKKALKEKVLQDLDEAIRFVNHYKKGKGKTLAKLLDEL